jgi:hypothetical protein
VTPLSAGSHTLEFVLYQVGKGTNTTSNPFGLLFTGTAPAAPVPELFSGTAPGDLVPELFSDTADAAVVPEPASCLLFGTVMCCLGWIQRRWKSAGQGC